MDFLKEILGDDLFNQVSEKINAHNGAEENKDKQVKLANLGAGGYVSKEKFGSKEQELLSKGNELAEANKLIEELKKGNKNNETLQQKIKDYETEVETLQAELEQTKIKSALKVALMGEHALDVDYLSYKLHEKLQASGESLEIDDEGNIKGWKEKAEGLKIQFPTQFESSSSKKIEEHKLEKPDEQAGTITRSDILKMSYQERTSYAEEHPEAYEQAMGRA